MTFKLVDGREYFYQWDLNRQIIVDDPTIKEIHFCNRADNCSLVVEVKDGIATVPNILLQKSFDIRVFAYDGEATLFERIFEVKARTQPSDYVYTETEIKRYEDLKEELLEEIDIKLTDIVENGFTVDLTNYYNKEEVDEKVSNVEVDLSGYATESYVKNAIAEAELNDKEVDLSGLATKDELAAKADKVHTHSYKDLTNKPELFSGSYNDLTDKPIIPSIDGLATEGYVDEAVKNVDLSGYATEDYVEEAIKNADIDLTEYAKKTDIPDVSKFITEIPTEYITESELASKGYLTEHQDISGKADVNHTHSEYAKTKHTHDMADINGLQTAIANRATQEDIDKAIELHNHNDLYAAKDHNHDDKYATRGHVHSYNDLTNKPTIPSIEGLASEAYVNAAVKNVKPDLTGYATEEYVDDAIANIEVSGGNGKTLYRHTISIIGTDATAEGLKSPSIYVSLINSVKEAYTFDTFVQYLYSTGSELAVSGTVLTSSSNNTGIPIDKINASSTNAITYYLKHNGTNANRNLTSYYVDTFTDNITVIGVASTGEASDVDLSNYYTKAETEALIPDISGKADVEHTHTEYALSEHEHEQYLTEHQSLEGYAKTTDLFSKDYNDLTNKPTIPSIEGLATTTYVDEAIANIDIPEGGGGSAEGAVSYLEAQELTTEQLNVARDNLDLPYIAYEDYVYETKSVGLSTGASTSNYVSGSWSQLLSYAAGVQFTLTITSPEGTFTEAVLCEKVSATTYKTVTDTTDLLFFNKTTSATIASSYFYISKKDTSAITSTYSGWKVDVVLHGPVYRKLLSPKLIDSTLFSQGRVGVDSSWGPTLILQHTSPSETTRLVKDNNIVLGNSNTVNYGYGNIVLGSNNTIPNNNSAYLIAGVYNMAGFAPNSSGAPVGRAILLGHYLRCSQNTNPILATGYFNDRTSKYIPYSSSTTYNAGDCVTTNATNRTRAVWRCKADGTVNKSIPTSGTAGNDYWEYVDNGSSSEYTFVVGNGTSDSVRSNAFTIDCFGNVVSAGTMTPTGADYAEYFEFEDGNPNKEDRIGYLVELSGAKIKLANGTDILGAVSSTMGVIGDAEEMNWHGKYERDEFGRPVFEEVEVEREVTNEETGETEIVKELVTIKKLSKDYDPNRHYAPRSDRPEWAPVGLLGKVLVRHDGSLVAGDYVKAINGIASKSEEKTNVRVLEVVSENVIRVLIK